MNDSISAAVESFLADCHSRGRLAPASLSAYRRDLKRLNQWCEKQGMERLETIDAAALRSFAASMSRAGLDPRSIQRHLSAIRKFFRYLVDHGLVDANPAADLKAPRTRRKLPRTLDPDQVLQLLEIKGDAPLDDRDRAMLELCYSSGLRVSELADARWDRLDTEQGLLRVIGKGNKERIVPVGRHALTALEKWRRTAASFSRGDSPWIFTTARGNPLGIRAIQKRIGQRARSQGLGQHVHPHQLRHSFASHILESSGDLRAVQELLGHANLSTTQIYTHLDFQHLAEVYDRAHPRAKKGRSGDI
ncbi:MAG: tyrosine recombinase XerC [Wenzhouxiangellaceae bacterium]